MWRRELKCYFGCTVFFSTVFLIRTLKETIHVSEVGKCIKV